MSICRVCKSPDVRRRKRGWFCCLCYENLKRKDFYKQTKQLPGIDGCLLWIGSLNIDGYGKFKHFGEWASHRVAWLFYYGYIPIPTTKDNYLLHRCDNPSCVRVSHLYIGTATQNMKDKHDRNRGNNLTGISHPMAKLSEEQVLSIREEYIPYVVHMYALAKKYGVTQMTIHKIISGKTWRHI